MKKKKPKVAGIDPSLTHTAICFGADPATVSSFKGGKLRGVVRLKAFYDFVCSELRKHGTNTVVIEGYAFMAQARHHRLGELGGVIRMACLDAGVEKIIEVPPSTLKKFWTGSGRASKAEMIAEVNERFSPDYHCTNDDIADAIALSHAALDNKLIRDKCEVEHI